ncbi:MAG: hypothetical protein GY878_11050 [Fuerstiella sp.]|jgi:hypothetical protein|nr:hypothetical protein [Fuerstiella sp.]MCP4888802.1 hypothetical protein [Planctomycetaceae bacterium]|tara:strand:+ start:587 stop:793 length:207 start_codon:yes stop_codon:yes gene_type:complete
MYTQDELETKVRALDTEISQGIKSVTTDGTSTTVDLDAKRKERDRYLQMLQSHKSRRPATARINLWGG